MLWQDPNTTQNLGFYADGSGAARAEPVRPTATPMDSLAEESGRTRRKDQSETDKLRFSCEGLVEKGKWEEASLLAEMWVALAPEMRSEQPPPLIALYGHLTLDSTPS